MDWIAALEALSEHQHIWRFRQLCAEDHPNRSERDGYRDIVVKLATGTLNESRPSVAETIESLRIIKRCQFRSVFPPCGCNGARCGLKNETIVSHQDCMECVRVYGAP